MKKRNEVGSRFGNDVVNRLEREVSPWDCAAVPHARLALTLKRSSASTTFNWGGDDHHRDELRGEM